MHVKIAWPTLVGQRYTWFALPDGEWFVGAMAGGESDEVMMVMSVVRRG